MRKTSYVVTFFAVLLLLILNTMSARLPDWLISTYQILPNTTSVIRYGLRQRCERSVISIPAGNGRLEYSDYQCRPFPLRVQDLCENENRLICAEWVTARYFTELGIGFASMALAALLIGVSTHSRRRRVWRAVAGLVLLHAIFQLITFVLITVLYTKNAFDTFDRAKPGLGYVFNVVSWVLGLLVGAGVIVTGVAADRGYKWAAGNRAYRPIQD